jgi:hypothetical protein
MAADDASLPPFSDRQIIDDALRLIRDLDNTKLDEMTPLFYMFGFDELYLAVRSLLRIMGEEVAE